VTHPTDEVSMKTTVIRYETLAGQADENAALIARVFEALQRHQPAGLQYQVMRGHDGVTFTHVATVDDHLPDHPLTRLPEFAAFVAGLRQRCASPRVHTESDVLGRYPAASMAGPVDRRA
jgi:hypothetical protein